MPADNRIHTDPDLRRNGTYQRQPLQSFRTNRHSDDEFFRISQDDWLGANRPSNASRIQRRKQRTTMMAAGIVAAVVAVLLVAFCVVSFLGIL